MARAYPTWESYFYPETYNPLTRDGTLVNLLGERDREVLQHYEYVRSAARQTQLELGDPQIARTYDATHLRAIHRHLFQDVYPWAGEFRGLGARTLAKQDEASGRLHEFAELNQIDRYLGDAHNVIARTDWPTLADVGSFAAAIAHVFGYLNQAHPFREGNGRTTKVFLQQVAELSPFRIPSYAPVAPSVWNNRSALAGPDLGDYEPQPESMIEVFAVLARPVGP